MADKGLRWRGRPVAELSEGELVLALDEVIKSQQRDRENRIRERVMMNEFRRARKTTFCGEWRDLARAIRRLRSAIIKQFLSYLPKSQP